MDSEGLVFVAEGHSSRLLSKMEWMRRLNTERHSLCDVILSVESREICAHRLVLSACSNYFCSMFTNKMQESSQERVILEDLDGSAVEDIVNFAYTAKIHIHEDNVQGLLKAASIFQLSEIVGACCGFLSNQLHASNCLGIARFAEAHGCSALEEAAVDYARDHFPDVIQCEEFVQLPLDSVKSLLNCEEIDVASEEEVFNAMYKWLTHDLARRENHAYELLSCIRLPLLNPLFLAEQVYSKPVFRKDTPCLELIMNAMIYHSVKERRLQLRELVNDRPRRATLGVLFVIGGMDTCRNTVSIECYNARKGQWMLISNPQSMCKRLQFGVAVLNSRIYIVGGRNGLRTLNTVNTYDPATSTWKSVTPMCSYRHGVSVAALAGPMYAVGGHDGWSYLSSVERYDPVTEEWSYIAPMSSPRSTAGVAVLDEKLYVIGGRDSNSCLSTLECYDPHTNHWIQLPPMHQPRGGLGVTVLDGKLYAIGGHETSIPLTSVELYDPKTNVWSIAAPLQCARDAVAAVTFGGKVYAIGGFDGIAYLDSVECYDAESDKWTMVANLRHGRAGAGVAVMTDFFVCNLPNAVL